MTAGFQSKWNVGPEWSQGLFAIRGRGAAAFRWNPGKQPWASCIHDAAVAGLSGAELLYMGNAMWLGLCTQQF